MYSNKAVLTYTVSHLFTWKPLWEETWAVQIVNSEGKESREGPKSHVCPSMKIKTTDKRA